MSIATARPSGPTASRRPSQSVREPGLPCTKTTASRARSGPASSTGALAMVARERAATGHMPDHVRGEHRAHMPLVFAGVEAVLPLVEVADEPRVRVPLSAVAAGAHVREARRSATPGITRGSRGEPAPWVLDEDRAERVVVHHPLLAEHGDDLVEHERHRPVADRP